VLGCAPGTTRCHRLEQADDALSNHFGLAGARAGDQLQVAGDVTYRLALLGGQVCAVHSCLRRRVMNTAGPRPEAASPQPTPAPPALRPSPVRRAAEHPWRARWRPHTAGAASMSRRPPPSPPAQDATARAAPTAPRQVGSAT